MMNTNFAGLAFVHPYLIGFCPKIHATHLRLEMVLLPNLIQNTEIKKHFVIASASVAIYLAAPWIATLALAMTKLEVWYI